MPLFPRAQKTIRTRIRSYERSMRKELAETGFISDGYGKRYLLGPLYLLMGDIDGALRSYAWFEQTFPDDSGNPMHLLCWTLVLYLSRDQQASERKLRQTMLSNLYLVPHLLGEEQPTLDMWHASNWVEREHLQEIPPEIFALWDDEARQWLKRAYAAPGMQKVRTRYIAIYKQLATEPRGAKRTRLVEEASQLERED